MDVIRNIKKENYQFISWYRECNTVNFTRYTFHQLYSNILLLNFPRYMRMYDTHRAVHCVYMYTYIYKYIYRFFLT